MVNIDLWPTSSAIFSTDLHSLGQYIQEGQRILFETVVSIKEPQKEIFIEKEENGWAYVEYNGTKGWCAMNYLEIVKWRKKAVAIATASDRRQMVCLHPWKEKQQKSALS